MTAELLCPSLLDSDPKHPSYSLAFLVPTLQSLVTLPSPPPAQQTSILILSPTRELALQIATAAEPFLRFLPFQYGIQTVRSSRMAFTGTSSL